jgi:hypothetical protein
MAQSTSTKTFVAALLGAAATALQALSATGGGFTQHDLISVAATFVVAAITAAAVWLAPNTVKEVPANQGSTPPPAPTPVADLSAAEPPSVAPPSV